MKKNILIFFFIIIVSLIYCNTLNNIIDKSIRFNKWDDAKNELEFFLKDNPADTNALAIYAAVLNELKMYDEAILAVNKAISYESSNDKKSKLYFDLGNYYFNKGLKEQALLNYQKSIEYNKNTDSSYYMAGLVYFENNDLDKALTNWKKYVEITNNIDKKIKMQKIISKLENMIADKKLKDEEERKKKEDYLKKLKDDLSKDKEDSQSLESDKNKTKKSDEYYEEIE